MAYRNVATQIANISAPFIALGDSKGKKIDIGVETQCVDPRKKRQFFKFKLKSPSVEWENHLLSKHLALCTMFLEEIAALELWLFILICLIQLSTLDSFQT